MYIVIEHTHNFSARLIQFWMIIDGLLHKEIIRKTYNHALISDGMILWEAVDKGVIRTTFTEHYKNEKYKKRFSSKHIKLSVSPLERIKIINYLREQEGKDYEFSNFIFHPLKTLVGKWIGSKTDRKQYCYELVIRALNASGKYKIDPYMNPREFFKFIQHLKT